MQYSSGNTQNLIIWKYFSDYSIKFKSGWHVLKAQPAFSIAEFPTKQAN